MPYKKSIIKYIHPLEPIERKLSFDIHQQPTEVTCGPTSLHSVYRYYGDDISLEQVIEEVPMLEDGGTLAVLLGCHALERGYQAAISTANMQIFDPTWFDKTGVDLRERLKAQAHVKNNLKLHLATEAYLKFLDLGGTIRFEDFTRKLIRKYLNQNIPILTGLSATFLYRTAREYGDTLFFDDIRGDPSGHFVVIHGYNRLTKQAYVADPVVYNPYSPTQHYAVHIDRLICAILLGILTHDANFLTITPYKKTYKRLSNHDTHPKLNPLVESHIQNSKIK
ncbi:MAG: hypothetical protein K0S74_1565 [Chlamydiales bacterium]|jgi:hypothetical protein|nr:hypothetical protein [Chlamydiales bacterium]